MLLDICRGLAFGIKISVLSGNSTATFATCVVSQCSFAYLRPQPRAAISPGCLHLPAVGHRGHSGTIRSPLTKPDYGLQLRPRPLSFGGTHPLAGATYSLLCGSETRLDILRTCNLTKRYVSASPDYARQARVGPGRAEGNQFVNRTKTVLSVDPRGQPDMPPVLPVPIPRPGLSPQGHEKVIKARVA